MKLRRHWILRLVLVSVAVFGLVLVFNFFCARSWEAKIVEMRAAGEDLTYDFITARRVAAETNAWEGPITSKVFEQPNSKTKYPGINRRRWASNQADPAVADALLLSALLGPPKIEAGVRTEPGEPRKITIKDAREGFPSEGSVEERIQVWAAPLRAPMTHWLTELRQRQEAQVTFKDGSFPFPSEKDNTRWSLAAAATLEAIALADLSLQHNEDAFIAARLVLQISRLHRNQRTLITHFQSLVPLWRALEVIDEGLKLGSWNEAQLEAFDQELGSINLLSSLRDASQGERNIACGVLEWAKANLADFRSSSQGSMCGGSGPIETLAIFLPTLLPKGCFDLAKVQAADYLQSKYVDAIDLDRQQLRVPDDEGCFQNPRLDIAYLYLRPLLMGVSGYSRTYQSDVRIKLTRIAIALERYRLANGIYPIKMEELVPRYLSKIPVDWLHNQPPKFEGTSDRTFRLWHVGWDGKDDGGTPPKDSVAETGDLSWPYVPFVRR